MRAPLRPRDLMAIGIVSVFALAASGTHVVRSGETLSEIAAQHGTSVSAVRGRQRPRQPEPDHGRPAAHDPRGGHVRPDGDRVLHLRGAHRATRSAPSRRKFGTTAAAIAAANGITDPNLIVVGRSLTVGGSGAGSGSSGGASSTARARGASSRASATRSSRATPSTASPAATGSPRPTSSAGTASSTASSTPPPACCSSIPAPCPVPLRPRRCRRRHTVANNETLSGIASRYGDDRNAIAVRLRPDQPEQHPGRPEPDHPRIVGRRRLPVPGARWHLLQRLGLPPQRRTIPCRQRHLRPAGHARRRPDERLGRRRHRHASAATSSGLRSADGTLWFGSHMDRFGKTGQVSAGDVIGYVGDSGNAKGGRPAPALRGPSGQSGRQPVPVAARRLLTPSRTGYRRYGRHPGPEGAWQARWRCPTVTPAGGVGRHAMATDRPGATRRTRGCPWTQRSPCAT